jgi:hypothetical protein
MAKNDKLNSYLAVLEAVLNKWNGGSYALSKDIEIGKDNFGEKLILPYLITKGDAKGLVLPLIQGERAQMELAQTFLNYFAFLESDSTAKSLTFVFLGPNWPESVKTYFSGPFLDLSGKNRKRIKVITNLDELIEIDSLL